MSSSPSKPLAIGSPRADARLESNVISSSYASQRRDVPVSASPRPDIERFRDQFSGTPPPNIPFRPLVPAASSPYRNLPSSNVGIAGGATPRSQGGSSLGVSRPSPFTSRPGTPRIDSPNPYARPESPGFLAGPSSSVTPQNLDDLPDEEKARILRRHLVSREQRTAPESEDAASTSRGIGLLGKGVSELQSSRTSVAPSVHHQEDTEPFPLPYNAQGGDITYVSYSLLRGPV